METISKRDAYEMIVNTKGKIFGVKFTKKDGTERAMSCRLHVTKGVKGVGRNYTPITKGLVGVYDMNNGFRMVNLKTLKEISFKGRTFKVSPFTRVFDF